MSGPGRRAAALAVALVVASMTACGPGPPSAPPFPSDTPKLVLFLVVDQLGQEYLTRLRPLLTGGLGHLLDQGVVFADAHHNHAATVTGAGHATLTSGCYPSRSGIIGNEWHDPESGETVYCVEGPEHRRSPVNLLVTTIGDWLKEKDPQAKVFAAGGKDRSAILTGGHRADGALWYSGGDWVTSGYYAEPGWLDAFNDRKWLDQYFGTLWEPLPLPNEALAKAGVVEIDEGVYQRSFPYSFGSKSLAPDSGFYGSMLSSPFSDRYLLELVKTMITEEALGDDAHPDFLGVAFHALDYVGHNFGPHSREALDTILRLDRTMGDLFDFVDREVGLENVVISLSADHGVVPLPAYQRSIGGRGERTDGGDIACFQAAGRTMRERHGDYEWLKVGRYLDSEAVADAGLDRAAVEREVAELLGECDSVEHVWTRSELIAAAAQPGVEELTAADGEPYFRQLFANSFHPDRSPDFQIQYEAFYLDRISAGTSHGTPYEYDTWVPLIIVAPGLEGREVQARVHTADLAPTLAGIMGIEVPDAVDGTDRSGGLRSR